MNAKEAAHDGAALLDQHHSSWFNLIDLSTLDLEYSESCVLGQVYGGYSQGKLEVNLDNVWNDRGWPAACDYGFCPVGNGDMSKEELRNAWTEEILARRNA